MSAGIDPHRRRLTQALLAAPVAASLSGAGCSLEDDPDTIRDASQLDSYRVEGVLRPGSIAQLSDWLAHSTGRVSLGGGRYSMGGQIAAQDAVHVDMRGMNRLVWINPAARRVRVQAGMRWRELQALVDPHDHEPALGQVSARLNGAAGARPGAPYS